MIKWLYQFLDSKLHRTLIPCKLIRICLKSFGLSSSKLELLIHAEILSSIKFTPTTKILVKKFLLKTIFETVLMIEKGNKKYFL